MFIQIVFLPHGNRYHYMGKPNNQWDRPFHHWLQCDLLPFTFTLSLHQPNCTLIPICWWHTYTDHYQVYASVDSELMWKQDRPQFVMLSVLCSQSSCSLLLTNFLFCVCSLMHWSKAMIRKKSLLHLYNKKKVWGIFLTSFAWLCRGALIHVLHRY